MIKTLITAAFATVSIVAVAAPAFAESGPGVYCDTGVSIKDNETTIAQALAGKGVSVSGIEEWNGCVRAYVTNADGSTSMAFYDPLSLQQVGGNNA